VVCVGTPVHLFVFEGLNSSSAQTCLVDSKMLDVSFFQCYAGYPQMCRVFRPFEVYLLVAVLVRCTMDLTYVQCLLCRNCVFDRQSDRHYEWASCHNVQETGESRLSTERILGILGSRELLRPEVSGDSPDRASVTFHTLLNVT